MKPRTREALDAQQAAMQPISKESLSSIGIVKYSRSDSINCICCDGRHILSAGVRFEHRDIHGQKGNANDLVWNFLQENWDKAEGRKVKLTIEFID
jgi:hypothetical protein